MAGCLVPACGGDDGNGSTGTSEGTDGTDSSNGTETTTSSSGSTGGGPGTSSGSSGGGTTTSATDSDSATTTAGTTGGADYDAFRFTEIYVRDPHFYVDQSLVGCIDATDMIPLNISPSVNEQFNEAMNTDAEPDGIVDLSFLLLFDPLDQAGSGDMDFASGDCTFPLDGTTCMQTPMTDLSSGTYTTDAAADCLAPTASEQTDMYSPEPNTVGSPCYLGSYPTVTIELGGVVLPLSDVQIGGTFDADPADNLTSGLMRGFLSEADADAAMLPMDLMDATGATYVSELLPGGTGNCAGHSDKDDNNGTPGWWMYVDYAATRVPFN